MIVIYAEKLDVGLKIAASLNKGITVGGKSVTMKNIESRKKDVQKDLNAKGYIPITFKGEECCVTWGQGHMCELKQAYDYNPEYADWQKLPVPYFPARYEIKVREGKKDGHKSGSPDLRAERQLGIIRKLFDRCDLIINATDDDREGELIFAYVYEYLNCRKPYKRVRLDSQTEEGFQKAFDRLLDSSAVKPVEEAGRCRAIADWMTGANLSVQMTLKYGKYFPKLPVITVGRIQTVVLDFIVEREKAIETFQSVPYWHLQADFVTEEGKKYSGRHEQDKILDEAKAKELYSKVQKGQGTVSSIEVRTVSREVPLLYSLSDLSRDANEYLGLTAKETLQLAQELYESGLTTYPRTESRCLTSDMKQTADETLAMLHAYNPQYAAWIDAVAPEKRRHAKRHYDTSKVDSHFAIIPTVQMPQGLSGKKAALYDLIARSLIRTIYEPAKEEKTTLLTDVEGEIFKTTGTMIRDPQWLALEFKKRNSEILPVIVKGTRASCSPALKKARTEPPKRYTDASLLLAMQTASRSIDDEALKEILKETNKGGIGRPSTQGPIIETVVSRYCTRNGKQIQPTKEAMQLIDVLPVQDLKSAEMTARWEQDLDDIAKGKLAMETFISNMEKAVSRWVGDIVEDKREVDTIGAGDLHCPLCHKPLIPFSRGWKCQNHASDGSGCSFVLFNEVCGVHLDDRQAAMLTETGRSGYIKGFKTKDGRKFESWLILDEKGRLQFSRESQYACPCCGKPLIRLANGYFCLAKSGGCGFAAGNEIAHKKLTDKQMEQLLSMGHTGIINGFVSARQKSFSASLQIDKEQKKVVFSFPQPQKSGKSCPVCGKPLYLSEKGYFCSARNGGCGFGIGAAVAGKKLPESELNRLFETGKTGLIRGFKAKDGRSFDAMLEIREGKVVFAFEKPEVDPDTHCPICQAPMSKTSKVWKCTDADCGFAIYRNVSGVELSDAQMQALAKGETSDLIHNFHKKDDPSSTFDAWLKVDEENARLVYLFSRVDDTLKCPVCGSPMEIGQRKWKCTGECSFALWTRVSQTDIPEKELRRLLEKGKTGKSFTFISKNGNPFEARLALKDGKVEMEFVSDKKKKAGSKGKKN